MVFLDLFLRPLTSSPFIPDALDSLGYYPLGDFCICTSYSNQKGVLGLVPENLLVLREHLTIIEDEERPTMHDVLQKKFKMFKYISMLIKHRIIIGSCHLYIALFEHLDVRSEVNVGDRGVPTVLNIFRNKIEGPHRLLQAQQ
ncbi:hypothetical protein J5N97_030087 [Dioscorea zingiberensis]|uniref:Uncharacterized protein n=1 Tax=Dioscorea zingiberensis TaxID=325984 RepID=A0A9D5BX04_9LILI|nr:hypothetical protein J5N97_030087 [Dioscorea zingiberensis]